MSDTVTSPGPFEVTPLSIEDGLDLAMWQTPGPWAVHDSLEPPASDEGYWAIRDAAGDLAGYCCFGEAARVPGVDADPGLLDVTFGLRPTLVGHGLGDEVARTVADHARLVAAGRRLRTMLPQWNTAGRRAAERCGFRAVGVHDLPGGSVAHSFLVFVLDGPADS